MSTLVWSAIGRGFLFRFKQSLEWHRLRACFIVLVMVVNCLCKHSFTGIYYTHTTYLKYYFRLLKEIPFKGFCRRCYLWYNWKLDVCMQHQSSAISIIILVTVYVFTSLRLSPNWKQMDIIRNIVLRFSFAIYFQCDDAPVCEMVYKLIPKRSMQNWWVIFIW